MRDMVVETYSRGPEPVYRRAWSDLASFEVHPVIASAEAAARVAVRWDAG